MSFTSTVSIDIGLRTLSLYKEYFNVKEAREIPFPQSGYDKFGVAKPDMKKYIDQIATCGMTSFIVKKDLGEKRQYFNGSAIHVLFQFLNELEKQGIFTDVDEIIIERQLGINKIATSLMYYIQAWFMIQYGTFKKVTLYPAKNKTRILGAPLKLEDENEKIIKADKAFRKKWSTMRAHEILVARNDDETIDYIFKLNKSKKDDLCDVITQCLSYQIVKLKKYHSK